MTEWIEFVHAGPSPSGLTQHWLVLAKDGGVQIGSVSWFGRWRKYAFTPAPNTVFEESCLRQIASFCEEKTRKHRELKKAVGT